MSAQIFAGMGHDLKKYGERLLAVGWTPHVNSTGAVRMEPPPGVDMTPVTIPMRKNPATTLVSSVKSKVEKAERIARPKKKTSVEIAFVEAQERKRIEELAIVSERPFLAAKNLRKGGGVRYESKATVERTWSDGTVDYACAWSGCDFVSAKPRSVSNHYGATHSQVAPATTDGDTYIDTSYVEPSFRRTYKPSDRLVSALSAQISAAIESGWDNTTIARAVLTWFHERPDLGSAEERTRPSVEMTPEQVLERIRLLVDSGRTARLEEQVAAATAELAESQAQVTRLLEERTALRELLT